MEFRTVVSLSSLPVLVHQFMKMTPSPQNVLSNYCFLEAVVSDTGILLLSGKLPLGRRALLLWGHRCCATGMKCQWRPVGHCCPVTSCIQMYLRFLGRPFQLAELQGHLVFQSLDVKQLVLRIWQHVSMRTQLCLSTTASSSWQEVVGVLRFDYSTTNAIHSKQLCLTANVFQFNVVGALIFMLGRNYWL